MLLSSVGTSGFEAELAYEQVQAGYKAALLTDEIPLLAKVAVGLILSWVLTLVLAVATEQEQVHSARWPLEVAALK